MSIPVPVSELESKTGDYDFAYVLSVTSDGRPRAVATRPVWNALDLLLDLGRSSRSNAADRPDLALVYPPIEAGGYSLIVDGIATVDVDADAVVFTPTNAVLHRPA